MKQKYEKPQVEIIALENGDVITASETETIEG
jgi:hypothetical protein